MASLLPQIDPNGPLEYSVVYTDRSLNHMSQPFQEVMRDVSNGDTASGCCSLKVRITLSLMGSTFD